MTAVAMVDIKVDKGVHPDEGPRVTSHGYRYRLKGPPKTEVLLEDTAGWKEM